MNSNKSDIPFESSGSKLDSKNIQVLNLEKFKNGYLLTDVLVHVIQSIGLSTVFSSFLMAAQIALEEEEDMEVKEAMTEFVAIGSSLNEKYVLRVSGQNS